MVAWLQHNLIVHPRHFHCIVHTRLHLPARVAPHPPMHCDYANALTDCSGKFLLPSAEPMSCFWSSMNHMLECNPKSTGPMVVHNILWISDDSTGALGAMLCKLEFSKETLEFSEFPCSDPMMIPNSMVCKLIFAKSTNKSHTARVLYVLISISLMRKLLFTKSWLKVEF